MKKNNSFYQTIIKAFEENDVSSRMIDIGYGETKDNDKRYSFRSPLTYEQGNIIKYAVKYITDKRFCIVWKKSGINQMGQPIPRNCFSIKAGLVNEIADKKVVSKWFELPGHNKETVLVCSIDSLKCGLKSWLISWNRTPSEKNTTN